MCIKWFLDKMGQFRTYNDISLANRLVRAQQDLAELKANQIYFMNSVSGFESEAFESSVDTYYDGYTLQAGWVGYLTFVGNKPEKDVLIIPKVECLDSSGNVVKLVTLWSEDNVVNGYPAIQLSAPFKDSDRSNKCMAILKVSAYRASSSATRFTKVRVWCTSNDLGILTVQKENYVWY